MFKDYYLILEIEPSATLEQIKIAFKKQAVKWHPDRNPNLDTTKQMQEINEAYLILKDGEARSRYDIEYNKFKAYSQTIQTSENKQRQKSGYQEAYYDYEVNDDILKKWMENARRQAVDLAKQTIKEVAELSFTATKAAGSKMLETFIGYAVVGVIFLIIFKACN